MTEPATENGTTSSDNPSSVLADGMALSVANPTNPQAAIVARALMDRLLNAIEADEAVADVIAAWPSLS